jgi:type II secretory ATPase GspE/PulE/Tfp pilus assembly ATPase PilB-like protein
LLASTINAVLAQRLVRKICHYCKEEVKVPKETVDHIKKLLATVDAQDIPDGITLDDDLVFYHGQGCSHCGNVGFKGRTVIAEAIEINDAMRAMVNEQVSEEAFHEKMLEEKLITMEQYGYIIALMGLTTIDEVLRVVQESTIEY